MNSLFNPLGFVLPVIVDAKLIYQLTCEEELKWDEPLLDVILEQWEKWIAALNQPQGNCNT